MDHSPRGQRLPIQSPFVGVLGMLCILGTASLAAQATASSKTAYTPALERALAATVSIEVERLDGKATGSGLLLGDGGLIATNAHVIEGARRVTVKLANGESFVSVGAIDVDTQMDLALIIIPGFGLPTAPFGNSDSVLVGQRLLAIGAPLGLEATVTDGLLSAVRMEGGAKRLQISVPVSPGSSGGPLLSEDGHVVGLVVSGVRGGGAENLNFAIPINYVRGRLPLITRRAPTPFAELGSVAGPGFASQPVGGRRLPPVNEGLDLDFTALDGAVIYSDVKGNGQLRHRTTTSYAVSNDPAGGAVIERAQLTYNRSQGLLVGTDLSYDVQRTQVSLGAEKRFSTWASRTGLVAGIEPESFEIHVEGTRLQVRLHTGVTEADVPAGIFPQDFIGAITAALPNDLPDETRFFVLDPATNRAQEVVVRAGERTTQRVPVPRRGNTCDKDTETKTVQLPVQRVTRRVGTVTSDVMVLASRPHLLVDGDVRCVTGPFLNSLGN